MDSDAMVEYYIYDNRLASFAAPQPVPAKRRGSNASSRAPKALSWPHKSIKPSSMARAGFVFTPMPSNPDNVTCFLCAKALDGWEQDDNPLEEHLKHSPECGWAITAAVEAQLGEYAVEDPRDPLMVEARKATFGDMWPHENRKGWSSLKTKALVEAGWKYTPLVGSDDNASCVYCQLALDNWEKGDKPWDEHYNRAPHCPFFSLISSKPAPKRAGRSQTARSSKASRLSLQSVATGVSDITSVADMTADIDDSVMTTASKASKKAAKPRKAPASRAKKTRAKKSEAVEVHEDEPEPQPELQPESEYEAEAVPPPPPKAARGRKRSSEEVEDSVSTNAEAPAPKKRATKTRKARGSDATEVSSADTDIRDLPEPVRKPAAKKPSRKASTSRKASGRSTRKASVSTVASTASPSPQMPDDDEIDRQLEADLDRPLDNDEDIPVDADHETMKAAAFRKEQDVTDKSTEDSGLGLTAKTDFAMFDPNPLQPTDEEIEAGLQAMQDEMDIDVKKPEAGPEQQPEHQQFEVPKKGRKAAGTRKVSKPSTTKKVKETAAAPAVEQQPQTHPTGDAEELDEIAEAEVSFASTGTVKRTSVGRASLGRVSLPRASLGSVGSAATTKAPAKRGRPKKVSQVPVDHSAEELVEMELSADPVVYPTLDTTEVASVANAAPTKAPAKRGRPTKKVPQVPVEEPAEVSLLQPQEDASHVRPEEPAEIVPPSGTVVYPTLEAMEVDGEPNSKPAVKTQKIKTAGKPRGRPPKSESTNNSSEELTIVQASAAPESKPEPAVETEHETDEANDQEPAASTADSLRVVRKPVPAPKDSPFAFQRKALATSSIAPPELLAPPPKTPRHPMASSQSAKQATISPSPSPQASDAENRPPSSKPGTDSSKRMPLGALPVSTPARQMSPSKQQQGKVVAGLQSTESWTAADLELIFEGENGAAGRFFAEGGEMSDHERGMSVEEWVYYNAGQAEQKLKSECEAMVSAFEREGTRAMTVLEGLMVEE